MSELINAMTDEIIFSEITDKEVERINGRKGDPLWTICPQPPELSVVTKAVCEVNNHLRKILNYQAPNEVFTFAQSGSLTC